MSKTEHQLDRFTEFARGKLSEDAGATMDRLYHQWRLECFADEDRQRVEESLQDLENGETGRDVAEFLDDFRQRNNSKA